jgi:protein O-GlcNAcase/histone acetyltransferase
MQRESDFRAGVVEGFYGQPWTQGERIELFDWMATWGLNTYLYAPKDDLHQRASWREAYSAEKAAELRTLLEACHERGVQFVYAISPGLDIRYRDKSEVDCVIKRFEQMLALGCRHFSLLFDDIPEDMHAEDMDQFGSLASAQSHVTNLIFKWVRERVPDSRLFFCPTAYCGRMAIEQLGGKDYLHTIGRELTPGIDIFWTGPEIISREITVAHLVELRSVLRRKPVIWDNLHANDYDGRRFFCGPYAGRPVELLRETRGVLSNPNNEFPLNFVPLRTLSDFVHCRGDWNARRSYLGAMGEWLRRFMLRGQDVSLDELILFGDCYYLPHEEGPEAEVLFEAVTDLVCGNPGALDENVAAFLQRATQLREFCGRLADLSDRKLFYALSRRVWELREELDLLQRYADFRARKSCLQSGFRSDFHLWGTYRGGMVARLQRLLVQQPDGTFTPALQNGAAQIRSVTALPATPTL